MESGNIKKFPTNEFRHIRKLLKRKELMRLIARIVEEEAERGCKRESDH